MGGVVPLSPRFSEALHGAAEIHAHQPRKGTAIPYIAHLLGVASIALHHGADEDEAIAALLHDAIEDAPPALGADWVRKWIRHRFGERVLGIVEGCTDAEVVPKPPWQARKEAYVRRLLTEPASVVLVSAAGKLHNAGAILSDYREIRDELWKRFNKDAGKAGSCCSATMRSRRCLSASLSLDVELLAVLVDVKRIVIPASYWKERGLPAARWACDDVHHAGVPLVGCHAS